MLKYHWSQFGQPIKYEDLKFSFRIALNNRSGAGHLVFSFRLECLSYFPDALGMTLSSLQTKPLHQGFT